MQILTSFDDMLFKDVPLAMRTILSDAVKIIDGKFGEGFAKQNPGLVASLVNTAGNHLNVSSALKVFESLAESGCFKNVENPHENTVDSFKDYRHHQPPDSPTRN